MKRLTFFALFVVAAQALPFNNYQFQHRSLQNPVFRQQRYLYKPSTPNIEQDRQFHALINVNNGGFCSGILVDADKVLTSAQCVKGGSTFEIRLNRRDLYNVDPSENANETNASSSNAIIHPEFMRTFEKAVNDLALLVLDTPVSITPVAVGGQFFSDPLTEYIDVPLVGYGLSDDTNFDGKSMQGYLQLHSTHSKPIIECVGYIPAIDMSGKHMCAEPAGLSSCFGDPGSPLLQYSSSEPGFEVIGIASFGSQTLCDLYGITVFTYVRSYHDWLAANGVPITGKKVCQDGTSRLIPAPV
ncbi:chymotrypsin-like elastase family member 2A [Neocloeon triangulifer]|uniref:chymotrypsin-like elastase family member 2A n=1 Tax=Neocloeon triangulifer TaxID=2078957 RepID=UPI00286F38E4|nr:chymotrypsin-like elastase family member 2A [Neocloeon triangulifer]